MKKIANTVKRFNYDVETALRDCRVLSDVSTSIGIRKRALAYNYGSRMVKSADDDQHGIFQHFQSGVIEYKGRDEYSMERARENSSRDNLYGVGPEHEDTDISVREPSSWYLSTRHSPDHIGVQTRRIGDNVYQDPITNKIYDYNEGFSLEGGGVVGGGSVDNQTKLVHLADRLDRKGFSKIADRIDSILKKIK